MSAFCVVDGCVRPVRVKSRGLCRAHYLRWHRHGDPLGGRPTFWARSPADVWLQVDQRGPDDCWPWLGPTDEDGYGDMRIAGLRGAHRIAYFVHTGDDPIGYVVCHHCDNPPCCNPAHLYRGTPADNNRDTHERGRWCDRKGSLHPLAKLSDEAVADIRRRRIAGETGRALAGEFGVAESTISTIVRHPDSHWSHV